MSDKSLGAGAKDAHVSAKTHPTIPSCRFYQLEQQVSIGESSGYRRSIRGVGTGDTGPEWRLHS